MGNSQSPTSLPKVSFNSFDCTKEWLASSLKVPPESIKSIRSSPLKGGNSGPLLHRLEIDWEGETKFPSTIVAKSLYAAQMPPREIFERFSSEWTWEKVCRKEFKFYTELQPVLTELGVFSPKCYRAYHDDDGDCSVITSVVADARTDTKMVLLLEDLGGYKCFKLGGEYLPHESCLAVVKMIARMHAMFWNKPLPGKDSEMVAAMYEMFAFTDFKKHIAGWILGGNFAEKVMEKWKDSEFGRLADQIPSFQENLQCFGDNFDVLVKPFLTDDLQKSKLFQNRTFVHGDFHLGNICVTPQNTPILYDWQCYGYGYAATELTHLLSWGAKFDIEKDKEIFEAYYLELTSDFGKEVFVDPLAYPYDVFEREMLIRFLCYACAFASMLYFTSPEDVDEMMAKKGLNEERWDGMLINMFERVFHILKDPKRDNKKFILTGQK